MRFTRFGITLETLGAADLEMIRNWRNSDWVRPYMRHREVIEPEDQRKWFHALDLERNYYFVTRAGDRPFACLNIKSIDWKSLHGESGAFIGDPAFIGRPEPAQATLALMDFGFLVLRLESLQARYNRGLLRVVRFNQQLGYELKSEGDDGFLYAQITAARYLHCAAPLRKAAATISGTNAILNLSGPCPPAHGHQPTPIVDPDFHLEIKP
jgi:RimJ/RimL family protein N-acetyltransferase